MRPELEICVDGADDLAHAVAGGADRIELCSALALGGLTPSPGLMAEARACQVPVYVMIRPRAGDFTVTEADLRQMEADIAFVKSMGLAGVVFGVADRFGALDITALRRLSSAAEGLGRTLHRVVDDLPDPAAAVDPAVELGFERILSSGGAETALGGTEALARMIATAKGRVEVMAGSGVLAHAVPALAAIGIRSFHSSCAVSDPVSGTRRLDPERLSALRSAITRLSRG